MSDVRQFVERFTRIWGAPQPEEFADLWAEDGTLLHPGMRQPIDRHQIVEYVRRLKTLTPDIRLIPRRWASVDQHVFIEWTITASVAGEQVSWDGVDRFTLRGDRAVEGIAYFDTLPLWSRLDPTMQRGSTLEEAAARAAAELDPRTE
jgi:uncharacterized protein (TIGR02246 family)